ncbi:MAG: tocopherol cyclase family protein [Saprospiraceae bacterium]
MLPRHPQHGPYHLRFLTINGEELDFTGGKGYMEKDWGRSFPSAYFWMQTNHFRSRVFL